MVQAKFRILPETLSVLLGGVAFGKPVAPIGRLAEDRLVSTSQSMIRFLFPITLNVCIFILHSHGRVT